MKIERHFTTATQDAYAALEFTTTVSEIRNPDGTVVFRNGRGRGAKKLESGGPATSSRRNTFARPVCLPA